MNRRIIEFVPAQERWTIDVQLAQFIAWCWLLIVRLQSVQMYCSLTMLYSLKQDRIFFDENEYT